MILLISTACRFQA